MKCKNCIPGKDIKLAVILPDKYAIFNIANLYEQTSKSFVQFEIWVSLIYPHYESPLSIDSLNRVFDILCKEAIEAAIDSYSLPIEDKRFDYYTILPRVCIAEDIVETQYINSFVELLKDLKQQYLRKLQNIVSVDLKKLLRAYRSTKQNNSSQSMPINLTNIILI